MRLRWLALFFGAVTLTIAQGTDADTTDDIDEPEVKETYFNGIKVPPLLEITGDSFDKEVKASKFLVVKYFK